ncbi:alpha/beta hydrolase-fold protein [Corynebacterium diphtheriae]
MRDTAFRKRGSLWIATAAVPVALAMGASVMVPANAQSSGSSGLLGGQTDYLNQQGVKRTPVRTDHPKIDGLPAGVSVDRVEWLGGRRVAVYVNTPSMGQVQVQILLARDWFQDPNRSFPSVWTLDGLRATDVENGWTIGTNIEQFYSDKNVNVILPVGGQSSFYSDWQQPNNGKHYKWETFLTNELVPVLKNGFRTNDDRAVVGLSMGGTAAINLAERRPDLFKFVGSFSGYLDTTSIGMPAAIRAAQKDAGGYDSTAMWGPDGSQDWIDHDPKLGVEALRGITTYVSAGSGRDDFGEPGSVANKKGSYAGIGLEVISRMTTETFVAHARRAGVEVQAFFRPSGVHDWPYWQFEMTQAWPYMANALGLSESDRGASCAPIGAIAEAVKSGKVGSCVNNEYDVPGGKVEDFVSGRAYWSPSTGAHALYGRINARYSEMGGPQSWLGFPISSEFAIKDNARVVQFQNGNIYWSPERGAIAVPKDIVDKWGEQQWENGFLGFPVAEAKEVAGGFIQEFEGGLVVRTKDNKNQWLRGEIAKKYREMKTAESELGFPVSDEIKINGGAFQQFEHGNIYWSAATGAHFIRKGDIFNTWGVKKWEQGELGFPVTDHTQISAGGEEITFQHGKISQVNGVIREERR